MTFMLIPLVIYIIPQAIVFWKLYKIAGKPGWTAVVPVYSTVVMAKIANKSFIAGTIGGFFVIFTYLRMAIDNQILGIGRLITVIFALYVLNAFIKKYNRGLGYWALVVFLPLIAVFITDKSQYNGSSKDGAVQNTQPAPNQPIDLQPNASTLATATPPNQPAVSPEVQSSNPDQSIHPPTQR